MVELVVLEERGNLLFYGKPIEMVQHEAGALITEPTCTLTMTAAQELMDELWRCGLRPSEGTGSAGALAATERHLKDMQKIAFTLLSGKSD